MSRVAIRRTTYGDYGAHPTTLLRLLGVAKSTPRAVGVWLGVLNPMSLFDLLYFQALLRRLGLRPRAFPPPCAGIRWPPPFLGIKSADWRNRESS